MLLVLLLRPAQGDLLGHHTLSFGDQIAVLTVALAIGTVPLVALLQVLQAVVSAAGAQWLAFLFGRFHVDEEWGLRWKSSGWEVRWMKGRFSLDLGEEEFSNFKNSKFHKQSNHRCSFKLLFG